MDNKFLPLNQEITTPWVNDIHNLAANLLSKKYGKIPKVYADIDFPPATWGSIGGDITDQLDLQAKLNTYLPLTGGTLTGKLTITNSLEMNAPIDFLNPTTGNYSWVFVNSAGDSFYFSPWDGSNWDFNKGLRFAADATGLYWNSLDLGRWASINPSRVIYMATNTIFNEVVELISTGPAGGVNSSPLSVLLSSGTATNQRLAIFGVLGVTNGLVLQRNNSTVDSILGGISYATQHIDTSDIRVKTNITQRYLSWQQLCELPLVTWSWENGSGQSSGTLAQAVQQSMPELVLTAPDGHLGIAEGKVAINIALSLVQELKQVKAELQDLKNKTP